MARNIKPLGGKIELPANGWRPRDYQLRAWHALNSPNFNEYYIAWHRRAGKDELILHYTVQQMMQRVGAYLHTLPLKNEARDALWEGVNSHTGKRRIYDAFPKELIAHEDNVDMRITLVNGSTWRLGGSDHYDNLLGAGYVNIVFSEAALCDPMAFSYLEPMTKETRGKMVFISSVRGRNHFHQSFMNGVGNPKTYTELLSAVETGVFTPEELEAVRLGLIARHGENIGETMFRQEYLSDWNASSTGAVFSREIADLYAEKRACPISHDKRYPVYTFWDLGVGHPTVILFVQEIGNRLHLIDWHADTRLGVSHYADVIKNKPYVYAKHYAPHDIANVEWSTGVSRLEEAMRYGIKFERLPRLSKQEQISAAVAMFSRLYVNVIDKPDKEPKDDCEFILTQLQDYRFNFNKKTRVVSDKIQQNEATDYGDAFLYMALGMQQQPISIKEQMIKGMPLDRLHSIGLSKAIQRGMLGASANVVRSGW